MEPGTAVNTTVATVVNTDIDTDIDTAVDAAINTDTTPCCPVPHSSLVEAALVAQDTVVCCLLDAAGEWRLCVWRGWGSQQFQLFYQSLEELGTMEVGMRRRR